MERFLRLLIEMSTLINFLTERIEDRNIIPETQKNFNLIGT